MQITPGLLQMKSGGETCAKTTIPTALSKLRVVMSFSLDTTCQWSLHCFNQLHKVCLVDVKVDQQNTWYRLKHCVLH